MSWYDIRFSDLMKVIRLRLGGPGKMIPDGLDRSDIDDVIRCIGYHFQARFGSDETVMWEALTAWCIRNCHNWKSGWENKSDIIGTVLNAIRGRRRDLTAIEVGLALRLTWSERCELGIRTIRPWDMTPAQFKAAVEARKLQMDRDRQEARRRREGKLPRSEWLEANSKAKAEPWKHMDPPISKATFYRRNLHLNGETGPSQLGGTPDSSDGPVSFAASSLPWRSPGGSLRSGTSVRISVSRRHRAVEAGSSGPERGGAKNEDAERYDALDPFGVATDKSQTKRRKNA